MFGKSFKIVAGKRFDLYLEELISREGEALVKLDYAAVCKADLRYYLGARDERTLGLRYPMNLLHEAVGTVIKDQSGIFQIGDKVVLAPNILDEDRERCENCVCDDPNLGENYCPQAKFASSNHDGFSREFISYPVGNLIRIPDGLEQSLAVYTELISVTMATYRRLNLVGDEMIAIWGDGVLGYILASSLKLLHKGRIIAIGKHESKLKEFPVDKYYFINDREIAKENIQIAYECVGGGGSSSAINEAIDTVLVGGKIVLTGVAEDNVPINTRKILEKGLSLYGVTRSSIADFEKSVRLFADQDFKENIEKLIIDQVEINNIIDFYNVFEKELANRDLGKYIMRFNF